MRFETRRDFCNDENNGPSLFEALIDFLAFLVRKVWPENNKKSIINSEINQLFCDLIRNKEVI